MLIALSACAAPPSKPRAERDEASIAAIAAGYKGLRQVTPQLAYVDMQVALLCTAPSRLPAHDAIGHGPHGQAAILVYMNDAAAGAFERGAAAYPVGAVVVKEKHRLDAGGAAGAHGVRGVGGMVKRAPGYDPAHGDWEYFYFEDPARIESGRIASCVGCHAAPSARDHVFGSWRRQGGR